ncbi:hypothetical protein B0H19DRAFT_1245728 [Mycena capillaripes]|nr:hypothetical protein B0H19DRAFT_1245728 [Mycena capillaripes]
MSTPTQKAKKAGDRRKRREAERNGEVLEPRKRGNPGNFPGEQLSFLQEREGAYLAAQGRGQIATFLAGVMNQWWEKFPWYKDLDATDPVGALRNGKHRQRAAANQAAHGHALARAESPMHSGGTEGVVTPPNTDEGASAAATTRNDDMPVASSTPDAGPAVQWASTDGVDPALKDEVQNIVAGQIKSWFSHRKTVANQSEKNPYGEWLKGFQRLLVAPRKQVIHKFYMQQKEFSPKVDARFKGKWESAKLEKKFELDFRCKCAKELLEEEPESVQIEVGRKLDAIHEAAVERHRKQVDLIANPDVPDPEAQIECRRSLAQVVQPFFDGVAKLTGYHVTLLAGAGPPPDSVKYSLTTLHSGRSWVPGVGRQGLKFDEWQPEQFKKKVMHQFMSFLLETNEHSATLLTINNDDQTSTGKKEELREVPKWLLPIFVSRPLTRCNAAPPEAEWPYTPVLQSDREMNAWLLSAVTALPTQEGCGRMAVLESELLLVFSLHLRVPAPQAELRLLSKSEFERENNIARNCELAHSLQEDVHAIAKAMKPTANPKAPAVIAPRRKSGRLANKDIAPLMLPEVNAEGDIVMHDVDEDDMWDAGEDEGQQGREIPIEPLGLRPLTKTATDAEGTTSGGEIPIEPLGSRLLAKTATDAEGATSGGEIPIEPPGLRPLDKTATDREGMESGREIHVQPPGSRPLDKMTTNAEGAASGGEIPVQRPKPCALYKTALGAVAGTTTAGSVGLAKTTVIAEGGSRAAVASAGNGAGELEMEMDPEAGEDKEDVGSAKGGEEELKGESRKELELHIKRQGWTRWMQDGHLILAGCAGGEGWHKAVSKWTELERAYGFKTSSKALPKPGRPEAVQVWTKYSRRVDKPPPLGVSVEKFSTEWWDW